MATDVLRAYVTRDGNGKYQAQTVTRSYVGNGFETAGDAQRMVDTVMSRHLRWERLDASVGIEQWRGYELEP